MPNPVTYTEEFVGGIITIEVDAAYTFVRGSIDKRIVATIGGVQQPPIARLEALTAAALESSLPGQAALFLRVTELETKLAAAEAAAAAAALDVEAPLTMAQTHATELTAERAKVATLEAQNSVLATTVATLRQEAAAAQQLLATKEEGFAANATSIDGLNAQIATLTTERDQALSRSTALVTEVANLAQVNATITADKASLTSDNAALLAGKTALAAINATLSIEKEALVKENTTLRDQILPIDSDGFPTLSQLQLREGLRRFFNITGAMVQAIIDAIPDAGEREMADNYYHYAQHFHRKHALMSVFEAAFAPLGVTPTAIDTAWRNTALLDL